MGMIWRSAMPLLTTLAALVIIVHCVEEDLETEYRHDLRPRILDTGTHSNDQPWRAIEETPAIQQRHAANWDDNSPDDIPKRRRSGRKRKRRPQTQPDDELIPQERFAYPDEPPRPYYDVDYENNRQTTEMPKRRRKKPDQRPIRWTDDEMVVVERPLRKRSGARRKRPSLEKWPTLSEFSDFSNINHDVLEGKTESSYPIPTDNVHEVNLPEIMDHNVYDNDKADKKPAYNKEDQPLVYPTNGREYIEQKTNPRLDDRSLSEFSLESITDLRATKLNTYDDRSLKPYQDKTTTATKQNKNQRKNWLSVMYWDLPGIGNITVIKKNESDIVMYIPEFATAGQIKSAEKIEVVVQNLNTTLQQYLNYMSDLVKSKSTDKILFDRHDMHIQILGQNYSKVAHEEMPDYWQDELMEGVDPLTLKDILKRSNGTSLSEILQQHNLSLADLLHGKEQAVSIFKSQDSLETQNKNPPEVRNDLLDKEVETKPSNKIDSEEQLLMNSETKYATEPVTELYTSTETVQTVQENKNDLKYEPLTTAKPLNENMPKISTRRRYPTSLRKKLRMRPVLNVTNSYKGQLSRDLITLNARRYLHHRKNTTKSKEWKDVIPSMRPNIAHHDNNDTMTHETTTATIVPEETTITSSEFQNNNSSSEDIRPQVDINKLDDINMDETESTASTEVTTEIPRNITDKPVPVVTMARPTAISSGLRHQAFNNRLKRKRLKHKNTTTESPQDDLIKHLFGMGDLVSSSEFIARTQEPRTTREDSNELTTVEDFATTESTSKTDGPMHVKIITTKHSTPQPIILSTTEETAKIEIEEIFNDTITSAKLSRILKERNMTLDELVEHRERGSSHVHLADIFHNASREPNPPEPFLSKSFLEPISKETYPLRAILEANLHDPNGKATTIDPTAMNNIHIPVVMDYRNNVNENAENMGIMSLFSNFTKNITETTITPEIEEKVYGVSEIAQNTLNLNDSYRERRVLEEPEDDVVSWHEIFSLMGRARNNDTEELSSIQPFKKITIEDDADGDGLIVLEDLQHLKDFDNNIALDSNEKLETDSFNNKDAQNKGILDKIPIQTKSVTVATASIVGLAMILFLLTYAAFKWKQQRSVMGKKRSFCDERIPTPVFENRKGHKNNSSTRSLSPMLQTSNIYTLNTLDSQHGKDSPDYMWDSLRKPFQ